MSTCEANVFRVLTQMEKNIQTNQKDGFSCQENTYMDFNHDYKPSRSLREIFCLSATVPIIVAVESSNAVTFAVQKVSERSLHERQERFLNTNKHFFRYLSSKYQKAFSYLFAASLKCLSSSEQIFWADWIQEPFQNERPLEAFYVRQLIPVLNIAKNIFDELRRKKMREAVIYEFSVHSGEKTSFTNEGETALSHLGEPILSEEEKSMQVEVTDILRACFDLQILAGDIRDIFMARQGDSITLAKEIRTSFGRREVVTTQEIFDHLIKLAKKKGFEVKEEMHYPHLDRRIMNQYQTVFSSVEKIEDISDDIFSEFIRSNLEKSKN